MGQLSTWSGRTDAPARIIMHLDMDAFFVNVELLAQPHLRGRPLIVARNSPRSVVLSASYEARRYGVRSAMPLARARQLCPAALLLEPSAHYRSYSAQVMTILGAITDRLEQVSVDEAFLDLTGAVRAQGSPVDIAQQARDRIKTELGLPSSVGISSSKFVAKMASAGSKPNGLWVVPPHRVQEFLDPLPVGKLWGVGVKSTAFLDGLGIHTVAQLREYDLTWLQGRCGQAAGLHLYELARGIDRREVTPERIEKSIGAEHTFTTDQTDAEAIAVELYTLCLTVARRLRAAGRQTRSLSLKIRYSDFETLTRSCPLPLATVSGRVMFDTVLAHLKQLEVLQADGSSPRPLRLLGVRAEKLEGREAGVQMHLFTPASPAGADVAAPLTHDALAQEWEDAENTMDTINARFGAKGLLPASLLSPGNRKQQ
ncbi:MAG: DNA polymerase IV [Rothia sp. (in: high G+C Gram-positive bacteria)]|uniref:DNA polymerase IV n=1 Tax=Rothia sp. (in: high G+C Gram-positive bacteria) TaxID=1885016 RepID=UPI00270AC22F|nr:DNA polymerase IV [Rothia sp. (in: high G+C Gram-positive bacteria)]